MQRILKPTRCASTMLATGNTIYVAYLDKGTWTEKQLKLTEPTTFDDLEAQYPGTCLIISDYAGGINAGLKEYQKGPNIFPGDPEDLES